MPASITKLFIRRFFFPKKRIEPSSYYIGKKAMADTPASRSLLYKGGGREGLSIN